MAYLRWLRKGIESIYKVFVIRQPELKLDSFLGMIDMRQYGELVAYITSLFGGTEETEKKTEEQIKSQEK